MSNFLEKSGRLNKMRMFSTGYL